MKLVEVDIPKRLCFDDVTYWYSFLERHCLADIQTAQSATWFQSPRFPVPWRRTRPTSSSAAPSSRSSPLWDPSPPSWPSGQARLRGNCRPWRTKAENVKTRRERLKSALYLRLKKRSFWSMLRNMKCVFLLKIHEIWNSLIVPKKAKGKTGE